MKILMTSIVDLRKSQHQTLGKLDQNVQHFGSNILAGTKPERILEGVTMLNRENAWKNPFGDGKAGERIVEILENE